MWDTSVSLPSLLLFSGKDNAGGFVLERKENSEQALVPKSKLAKFIALVMDTTAKRSYGLPPIREFIWQLSSAWYPVLSFSWLSVAINSLGTEAFCLNECFSNMLAGRHELTWWGPWISQLTSLKGGLMARITGRWRKGNSPFKLLYKLTSVVFPSSPPSCLSCPLSAISVHKPMEVFFVSYLSRFLPQHPCLLWFMNSCSSFKTLVKCHFSLMSFYSFILQIFIKPGTVLAI